MFLFVFVLLVLAAAGGAATGYHFGHQEGTKEGRAYARKKIGELDAQIDDQARTIIGLREDLEFERSLSA